MKENKEKSEKKKFIARMVQRDSSQEEKQVHSCPSAEIRHVSTRHLRQDQEGQLEVLSARND